MQSLAVSHFHKEASRIVCPVVDKTSLNRTGLTRMYVSAALGREAVR